MSQLRSNRIFLVVALLLLGIAGGIMAVALHPEGTLQARSQTWGPQLARPSTTIEGYAADRQGGACGLRRRADGATRALPRCHSYVAPEVVTLGSRTLAVWETGGEIAVSRLDEKDLSLGETIYVPRPQTELGALLPRTRVNADLNRLAVWYGSRVLSVGVGGSEILAPWSGGALEVAGVRLGSRVFVLLFAAVALLAFYLTALSWTFGLPKRLAAQWRSGHVMTATLPERGRSIVVEGQPWVLDLSQAWTFGGCLARLAGRRVTLVLSSPLCSRGSYRQRGRLRVAQVWLGRPHEALAQARALRTGTAAFAVLSTAILLFGLDAYLTL